MKLSRLTPATAVALGLLASVGFSSQAHAGAFAWANLEIDGFVAQNVAGNTLGGAQAGVLVPGTDITVGAVTTAFPNEQATLNGSTVNGSNSTASTFCIGNCTAVTTQAGAPFALVGPVPPIHGNFSEGANALSGALVAPGGANAQTAAQTQLSGTATGSAGSVINLNASFNFNLLGTGTKVVDLSWNAISHLLAGIDSFGLQAQASNAFSISITDNHTGQVLFTWAPNGNAASAFGKNGGSCDGTATTGCQVIHAGANINRTLPAGEPGPNSLTDDTNAGYDVEVALPEGDGLTLALNHQSAVNATSVPEPASMALFAAGLLGVGYLARRRQRA